MAMKKGSYFFILDAFIGGTIIFFTLLTLTNAKVVEPIVQTTSYTANEYLEIITTTQVRDFQNPYLNELRLSQVVNDSSKTLIIVIVDLWESGNTLNATELVGNFTPGIIPSTIGIRLSIDENKVYSLSSATLDNAQSVSTTRTLVVDSITFATHVVEVKTWV